MAEMALGYGSEFQLLRYLGHHRNYLNQEIKKVIGDGDIEWLDYPIDTNRDSRDGEWKGIECFCQMANYEEIRKRWMQYWPKSGNSQNWDGIFIQNDVWYFVEAKANLEEAHQKCGAISKESLNTILSSFTETCGNVELAQRWLTSNCYQLANRLAFVNFCDKLNIRTQLLYISFVNGYEVNPKKNVSFAAEWEKKWNEEIEALKLSNELRKRIYQVTIDCRQPDSHFYCKRK